MTRNLHAPSFARDISTNRFMGKDTRQRPFAGTWVYPVDADDPVGCPPTEGGTDQFGHTTHLWTPCLQNSWIQVDPGDTPNLESFAFRAHYDGSLELKGHLDASGGAVSGTIAMTLPGYNGLEPDYLSLLDNGQYFDSLITDDAGTSFQFALAKFDAVTGDMTITWPAT